jgi:hypothetical protein
MEFRRIFTKAQDCSFWAACYAEDAADGKQVDIFKKKFELWEDTQYLRNFFRQNLQHLADPYWAGISVSSAIDQVLDEVYDFQLELYKTDMQKPGYEHLTIKDIFKPLHNNEYALHDDKIRQRKARTDPTLYKGKSMLRIYAIELTDCLVVTGGAIKITEKMLGEYFRIERARLDQVQEFLDKHKLTCKQDLLNFEK